ncbi:MAG: Rho GTPase activation protein [Linnemannia elongata]|nr:MAG: Rho GTPase activation protein [Linnemannia elongata]
MTSRHSRMPSDVDRDHPLPPTGLSRATPILPLGMPPMTKEAKESKEQAAAWETSLNRVLQTMHGDDTARYLAYFKARIEIEDTYSRGLEKLASLTVSTRGGSKSTGNTTNARDGPQGTGGNNGGQGNNSTFAEPDEIPTTLHKAYEALMDTTLQAYRRRQPFIRLLKNLSGALAGLKEAHEKQRKTQKENTKPVFQLYAEQRLVTVPKAKRNYEQRCRDVEQVLAIEDVEHLPVRERLKNLASTSGAAGRLAKSKRDMEDADGEYKTAVQTLEVFRMQREMRFDTAYKTMQGMIEERGAKCRQCLEAYVNEERAQITKATEEIDRFSVVINCIKPVGDMEQLSLSFTKDINSHPKTVVYESYYKPVPESIFGMSLQEYVDKHKHPIPLVIIKCSEAIDRAWLNREGIYRVSGRHAQIMNLKRLFDSDEEGVDFTNPVYSEDCTSIAAVLKIYLRELPQPLFPFALNERIAYSSIPDRNVRLGELKGRLKALPGCNIDTLQFLIEHLRRIYDHVETNKMTLDNLSMIFTPAIFHDFNSANRTNCTVPVLKMAVA